MAVVVREKSTGEFYVVLGAGYAMWATARAAEKIGEWGVQDRNGAHAALCVCNAAGRIGWVKPHEVEVVSVDGQSPEHLLGGGAG